MPHSSLPDGRPIIEITVKNSKDPTKTATKRLLGDTGAHFTTIDTANVAALGGEVKAIEGSTRSYDRFHVDGLTMDVECEDETGAKSTKSCSTMYAMDVDKRSNAGKLMDDNNLKGILGMDQFDTLGADPAKYDDTKRVYMRLRRREPEKKEKKKE